MDREHLGGLLAVVVGLVVLLAAFLVAAFHYKTAGDVSTALAAVTGTIGTLVGAYFGVQAGSRSGERAASQAENARAESEVARLRLEDVAVRMAAAANPQQAMAELHHAASTPPEAPRPQGPQP